MKMGIAFGMARVKGGFHTKEELIFILADDETVNEQRMKEFAERYKCGLVEVWYREDTKWDEIKFYKYYNFLPQQVTENEYCGMSIYR